MTQHALIIEDDAYSIEVLGRLLRNAGLSYTAVQDTTRVDAALKTLDHLDIVFLDLEMPHMNGYQMLEHLQQVLTQKVPIVACTVHANEITNAYNSGFHSFLGKPLDMNRFNEQLTQILNNVAVWDA